MVKPYRVEVKQTRRNKSIGIRVKPGLVELSCPQWADQHLIDRVLRERASWIERQLQACAAQAPVQKPVVEEGAVWMFRGEPHALRLHQGPRRTERSDGEIRLIHPDASRSPTTAAAQLDAFLKAEALGLFTERTGVFAERMQVRPAAVRVRRYRARWGSCSQQGVLTYHWPIIQAPDSVSDYLMVHELAHLVHFDHSPAFWRLVESIQPDWKAARAWLKRFGAPLLLP